jgi:hypothetical protein
VDGVTWQEYEDGLEDRLTDLHGRVHRGAYRAMLPDETQGKITSPETGTRQGLGGPDLEGVAERCGRDERCASEGVGRTSTQRTPASMGARTEEKSQASCQGR